MTELSLYKILFISEILVAEGLFTFRMEKRKLFPLRLLLSLAVSFAAAYFYPLFEESYTGWYVSVMFLVLFLITLGGMLFTFKISFKKAAFCAIVAYTAQHLAYEIFKMISQPFAVFSVKDMYGSAVINLSSVNAFTIIGVLAFFDVYLVVYSVAYFVVGKNIWKKNARLKNGNLLILSVVILLVDIILNAYIVYVESGYDKTYDAVIGIYNVLCCLLVLYILRNVIHVTDIEDELKTISHLLQQAKTQYQIKKEEIDLINVKCHDLKHQISMHALQGGLDKTVVAEIRDMISIYDATVKTGNEVLDIILTEKSLICQSKQIRLTVMADGSNMNFMSDGELYALFGNIFDNAIEAASKVETEENRCIDVNIRNACGFVSIMAENYYDGELRLDSDGMPVTLKKDKENHGFGIRSIELIARKYNGNVAFTAADNIFRLEILLPIADTVGGGVPDSRTDKIQSNIQAV